MAQNIKKILFDLFSIFNRKEVRYILMRGYYPISEINSSKDIDIFVHPADFSKANYILKMSGWKSELINTLRYPHVMYHYILDKDEPAKIDLVNGIYFGNDLLFLLNQNNIFDSTQIYYDFKIANPQNALILLMLHITFDKKMLSKENHIRLINTLNQLEVAKDIDVCLLPSGFFEDKFLPLIKKIVKLSFDDKIIKDELLFFSKEVEELNILKKNLALSKIMLIKRCILSKFKSVLIR